MPGVVGGQSYQLRVGLENQIRVRSYKDQHLKARSRLPRGGYLDQTDCDNGGDYSNDNDMAIVTTKKPTSLPPIPVQDVGDENNFSDHFSRSRMRRK